MQVQHTTRVNTSDCNYGVWQEAIFCNVATAYDKTQEVNGTTSVCLDAIYFL